MSRRRERRKQAERRKQTERGEALRRICLAALTALSVAAPLILSESTARQGTGVLLVVLTLLLAVIWLAVRLLQGQGALRCDWVTLGVLGLVGWHGVSALVMGPQGAPRPAINMFWQWVAYGTAFLLARDLVRSRRECRAVCAAMIGLAVGLSAHAYYQYFVEMPQVRAAYREDPEGTLREQGLYSPEGSVAREMFDARLFSSEPTATFALTNSLAGFLAPWLVLTLATAAATRRDRAGCARYYGGVLAVTICVGGCLLLTKSRTALLATGFGIFLIVALRAAHRWNPGWKIPLAAAAVSVALIVAAVGVGSLDVQMVSEAPKSLLYRFQYWHGSLRLIADYPWFGCGPGNFQSSYTAYMLPEASEQVADPHNFLFEVWTTAGTPAMLMLVATLAVFAWRVVREGEVAGPESSDEADADVNRGDVHESTRHADWYIYVGAACGVVLAYPIGLIAGVMPAGVAFWLGLPAAAATIWLLHPWVVAGVIDSRSVAIAVAVLLVNMLAAGGIGLPGVAGSLWLLMALALANVARTRGMRGVVDHESQQRKIRHADAQRAPFFAAYRGFEFATPRWTAGATLVVTLALLAGCFQTAYRPVLNCRIGLERGESLVYASRELADPAEAQKALLAALRVFEEAVEADPFAVEPRMNAARIYHDWRLRLTDATAKATAAEAFAVMASGALNRDRRSHAPATAVGYMEFEAYDVTDDVRHLSRSKECFRRAVELFPNNNFARARLAWTLHLAGDQAAAAKEAAEALRLDALTPHRERKLAQRGLFDDLAAPEQIAELSRLPAGESAEQLMLRLRNESKRDAP